MNSTASHDPGVKNDGPGLASARDWRALIEELSCAIADAQAALFSGRIQDLESCIIRQRELCVALKSLPNQSPSGNVDTRELVVTARRVREQNMLFGAVARRMRRHLETLRNLLRGLSLSYQPKPGEVPRQES